MSTEPPWIALSDRSSTFLDCVRRASAASSDGEARSTLARRLDGTSPLVFLRLDRSGGASPAPEAWPLASAPVARDVAGAAAAAGCGCILLVPLRAGRRTVGTLVLGDRSGAPLEPEEVEVLEAGAALLAGALALLRVDGARPAATPATPGLVDALLEACPGAVAAVDPSIRFAAVNRAMAQRFGTTPRELAGRDPSTLVEPELFGRRRQGIRKVFETGQGAVEEDVRDDRRLVNRMEPAFGPDGRVEYVVVHSADVTERRSTETELRASVAFREALATCHGSGLVAVDAGSRIVYVNPAFCAMVGWSEEELLGLRPPFPYWAPEAVDRIAAIFRDHVADGQRAHGLEVLLRHRDDRRLQVFLTTAPLVVEGKRVGWLASMVDITRRLQAEEALHQSEMRLRLALAAARAGIWEWNPADGSTYWSETSYRIHGLDPSHAAPLPDLFLSSLAPEWRDEARLRLEALAAEPQPLDVSYRTILPDGTVRWVRDIGEPDRRPDGTIARYVGIKLDVTDAAKAEAALRASERNTRTVLEAAISPFLLIDLAGVLLDVNDATCRLLGLPREEVVGRRIADFVVDPPPGRIEARIARARGEGGIRFGTRVRSRDGSVLDVEVSLSSFEDPEGRLVCFLHDVTEAKAAERALAHERAVLAERVAERTAELSRANEELANASRLKDEFLASTSHELRTPLTAILGLSEILLGGARGALEEHQARAVRMIQDNGRHLLALINDILDVSKIEAGRLELLLGWVDLRAVCEAALSIVTPSAVQRRHALSLRAPAPGTLMRADERRLKQVLVNLLANAVKFTPPGGALGLVAEADEATGEVRIEVWDSGPGIAVEARERLFKPFVQLDARLAREHAGTGLGLVLVDRLTALHGGHVELESEPGQGSRFRLRIPWTRRALSAAALPSLRPVDEEGRAEDRAQLGGGACVLVVEDDDTQRALFVEALAARGFRVEAARNGIEGLEKAARLVPDAVVMDVQMPGMDGLEAMRRLRAEPDLARIPILALTALVMPGDRERCREAGADDYLSKPVALGALGAAVGKLVRRADRRE